jgi:hypothetical protein
MKTPTLEATRIYEDNKSCIVLTHSEATRQRTKHIALKYHHFWDHIKNGAIHVIKVHTNYNWADISCKASE